jgi:hypothetical protein
MNTHSSLARGGRHTPPAPGGAESVEHVRRQVDRLCWTGILLGLAFTMTNVQSFAAAGARTWSLSWLAAGFWTRWCRWCCWRFCGPSRSPLAVGFTQAVG